LKNIAIGVARTTEL